MSDEYAVQVVMHLANIEQWVHWSFNLSLCFVGLTLFAHLIVAIAKN